MRKIAIIVTSLCLLAPVINSCELARPIDDFEPLFQTDADQAITNANSAELSLAGAYSGLRGFGLRFRLVQAPKLFSGTVINFDPSFADYVAWALNDPIILEETGTRNLVSQGMTNFYRIINDANWVIEKVGALDNDTFVNPQRRMEILGEAHALRAFVHLSVLQLFGQWYDDSSPYGIVLRLKPVRDNSVMPRNTVAETYPQIHSDLDFAIDNAPELSNAVFMNKVAAIALKARAYLHQGDYDMAATTAKTIIDGAGSTYSLSPTYSEIFDYSSGDFRSNPEQLFGVGGQSGLGEYINGEFSLNPDFRDFANMATININGQNIRYDFDRVESTISLQASNGTSSTGALYMYKYADPLNQQDRFEVHFRLAEAYLIFAEAEARSKGSVTPEALEALNAVRLRAGATDTGGDGFEVYPASITLDQFLEAVRIEKRIELAGEAEGQEWFDLVRYDWEDGFGTGFQVSDQKPEATDPNRFILPYPFNSTVESGGIVEQNPGY